MQADELPVEKEEETEEVLKKVITMWKKAELDFLVVVIDLHIGVEMSTLTIQRKC